MQLESRAARGGREGGGHAGPIEPQEPPRREPGPAHRVPPPRSAGSVCGSLARKLAGMPEPARQAASPARADLRRAGGRSASAELGLADRTVLKAPPEPAPRRADAVDPRVGPGAPVVRICGPAALSLGVHGALMRASRGRRCRQCGRWTCSTRRARRCRLWHGYCRPARRACRGTCTLPPAAPRGSPSLGAPGGAPRALRPSRSGSLRSSSTPRPGRTFP